jgi:hypothetical protein
MFQGNFVMKAVKILSLFIPAVCIKTINPLNAELKLICHLLALLGTHPILHVSRISVNRVVSQSNTAYFGLEGPV